MYQFKDGDIISTAKHFIWWKPTTWLPVLIRKITKGRVSHSAVIIMIDGVAFVAESKVPKVQLERFNLWLKRNMDVYVTIPETVPTDFRERVLSKIGNAKYDYRLLFFTQPIYQLTGIWIPTKQGQKGEPFTCSEFVAYTLNVPEPWKKVPNDLIKDNYELV